MLNVPGLRVYLGAWLGSVVSASVKVYAKGARDGLADLPGVVLGEEGGQFNADVFSHGLRANIEIIQAQRLRQPA